MIKIEILNSKSPSQKQELEISPQEMMSNECFIGRSKKCNIVLASSEVSRVHGSITLEGGTYYYTDLASLGGSRVNAQPAQVNQKYVLDNNNIIRIGEFILTVKALEFSNSQIEDVTSKTITVQNTLNLTTSTQNQTSIPPIPQITPSLLQLSLTPHQYMPVAMVAPEELKRWTKGELTVRCLQIIDETYDVKTFRFVSEPPVLFTYKPGQFTTLNLNINGKPVKRSYSISSSPSRPHTLEITVKRVLAPADEPKLPPGLISNWLHDNITVGSEIKLSGPYGKFTCFANPSQKLLLISAGSGITPMISMSRWITDTVSDCDIVFLHSARSIKDIIFAQELELMAKRYPLFRVAITLTRLESEQSWNGLTGRINEAMLSTISPDFRERTVYVCGPNAFMQGTKTLLESLGFPLENYYEESFGAAKKVKSQEPLSAAIVSSSTTVGEAVVTPNQNGSAPLTPASSSSSVIVVFKKSAQEIFSDGQCSILDLAEEAGINIDSSCRGGVCGTCKLHKLEGEVRYDGQPEALDESEQEQGYILTCIACPVTRVVLDV